MSIGVLVQCFSAVPGGKALYCLSAVYYILYAISASQSKKSFTVVLFRVLCSKKIWHIKTWAWTSLVAQWLRIRLPMQGTWVQALVREDPTCRGVNKLVHHNYWACALQPASCYYWAHVPQLLKPVCLEPVLHNKRSHRSEKPAHRNEE